jgi:hypothetical protein
MSSTQEVGEIFGAGSGPAHAMLRSPTVLIASVGLWGMNVFFFGIFGIDYVKVLRHDLLQLEMSEDSTKDRFLFKRQYACPIRSYRILFLAFRFLEVASCSSRLYPQSESDSKDPPLSFHSKIPLVMKVKRLFYLWDSSAQTRRCSASTTGWGHNRTRRSAWSSRSNGPAL